MSQKIFSKDFVALHKFKPVLTLDKQSTYDLVFEI